MAEASGLAHVARRRIAEAARRREGREPGRIPAGDDGHSELSEARWKLCAAAEGAVALAGHCVRIARDGGQWALVGAKKQKVWS